MVCLKEVEDQDDKQNGGLQFMWLSLHIICNQPSHIYPISLACLGKREMKGYYDMTWPASSS